MCSHTYKLTFEERSNYLYVRLLGKDSFAASLSYWNEIADKARALNARKLLVHEDLIGEINNHEMFDLITDLLPSGLLNVQIAVFDENTENRRINAIGQALAHNMGGQVEVFESLEAAQEWLNETA